jgi:pyridoxamine 5'-phosphate oxidase
MEHDANINEKLYHLRSEFTSAELSRDQIGADPFVQFRMWFDQAVKADVNEVQAMVIASVSADDIPSTRIVYLREIDADGFVFYTNYDSNKGHDFIQRPRIGFTLFWPELERQIQVRGLVEKVSPERSDAYFESRPRASQIGAWASNQSSTLENRAQLEARVKEITAKYEGQNVPRPPHWGGFKIIPISFEFWQGRPSRLHDRIQFRLDQQNNWKIERLSP